MMKPVDQIMGLLSGKTLTQTDEDDTRIQQRMLQEFGPKAPLVMKNLLTIAKQREVAELGRTPCTDISARTTMLETLYAGSTMKLELPDINPMSLSETTDNYAFGRRLLNFLAIAVVLYMFAKLLLS